MRSFKIGLHTWKQSVPPRGRGWVSHSDSISRHRDHFTGNFIPAESSESMNALSRLKMRVNA
jgi:hypothetical protein